MNRETTEFAEYRFPQRMARDVSYYYAGRHFKPARWEHVHEALRMAATFGCAVLIGVLIGKGL